MLRPHLTLDALLEGLLPGLQARIGAACREGLPHPIPIVVPSKHTGDWLQTRIAQRTGLCMGFEFIPPQELINRVLQSETEAAGQVFASNLWSPENLVWRLLPFMPEFAGELGLEPATASVRDLFALATLVVDQFDQYAHFRPELFSCWHLDKPVKQSAKQPTESLLADEAWQRRLFRRLNADIAKLPDAQEHPALVFTQLADQGAAQAAARRLPHLFVIGIGTLDPLLVETLLLLERGGAEIATHVVLPSLHYLDDLRRQTEVMQSLAEDAEQDPPDSGNPLLLSMGRQAIGAFQLMGQLDENFSAWDDGTDPEAVEPCTGLLATIQSDIRALRLTPPGSLPVDPDDGSLRLHACHGPRREMEVLRDELLRAFAELPGLRPDEVLVLCPDLGPYAALAEAVLRRGTPPLPVRVTELPAASRNPLVEAILALLDYSHGRWPASGLIELTHLPAVRAHLGLGDDEKELARLHSWIRDSGLTEEGAPDAAQALPGGSWLRARDRLVAGAWFGHDNGILYPNGEHVLPVAGSLEAQEAGRDAFLAWLARLERTLREWRRPCTPAAWAGRLSTAQELLLSSPLDEQHFPDLLGQLELLASQDCPTEVDGATMLDWLSRQFEAHSAARSSLTGDIAVGRFRQLQNQPCRVLAMLGMQDGQFPRQSRRPAWDLLQLDPRRWDRNPRTEDRQLFLDALLAPRDRLIILGSVLNLRTGKREPYSACVDELLRMAPGVIPETVHKLYPFSPHYFSQDARFPGSFDRASLAVAGALRGLKATESRGQPFYDTAQAGGQVDCLGLDALLQFWKDPARDWVRTQGIQLPREEDDERELDRPPLTLDALDEWQVRSLLLEELLASGTEPPRAYLDSTRLLPPGHLGNNGWERLASAARAIAKAVLARKPVTPAPMELQLPGLPRLDCLLHLGAQDGATCLLSHSPGSFRAGKDFLPAWLEALVAAASGREFSSVLIDCSAYELGRARLLPPIPHKEALVHLEVLLKGYQEGRRRPLCYAPVTSEAYLDALKGAQDPDFEKLMNSAGAVWEKQQGEGRRPAALLAWRDLDPFSPAHAQDWHTWARDVAGPLKDWWKSATEIPA
jgi:exodeoxyribonuclease V gamma subunit